MLLPDRASRYPCNDLEIVGWAAGFRAWGTRKNPPTPGGLCCVWTSGGTPPPRPIPSHRTSICPPNFQLKNFTMCSFKLGSPVFNLWRTLGTVAVVFCWTRILLYRLSMVFQNSLLAFALHLSLTVKYGLHFLPQMNTVCCRRYLETILCAHGWSLHPSKAAYVAGSQVWLWTRQWA